MSLPPRPDFLCIGVQKAGTTWLNSMLSRHPSIWLPPIKELHYFDHVHLPVHQKWIRMHRARKAVQLIKRELQRRAELRVDFPQIGLLSHIAAPVVSDDWYREIFSRAPDGAVCGEMSPEYSLLPAEGIRHIERFNPEFRAILLLRDPIGRAWSHARMLRKNDQFLDRPFEEIAMLPSIVERGRYREIVQLWRSCVPPERLLIGFFDQIAEDGLGLLRQVCAFLHIPFDPALFPNADEVVHKGMELEMPAAVYEGLRQTYADDIRFVAEEFGAFGARWRERHYGAAARAA